MHVRRYGIHKADDEVVFKRAIQEDRVLVSADTDFSAILTAWQTVKPSVILIKRPSPRRADAQASLLLANRTAIADLLDHGSIIVFEEDRLLSRAIPNRRGGRS